MKRILETKQRKELIELAINGETYELAAEPQETLLEVLRDHLGLTGTKEGCGTGECGSCTILLDGDPVLSCLMLAVDCQDRQVTTVEGLGGGEGLGAVQKAFLEAGAVQCGFCTPGMVLATTALLTKKTAPDEEAIKEALEGHLCRCTGYTKILEAVNVAAERSKRAETLGVQNGRP